MSKLENLHQEHVYKIVSVKDHELLNICTKYIFSGNVKHCNWKHIMWQYFESAVEHLFVVTKLKYDCSSNWLGILKVFLFNFYPFIFHFY